MYEYIFRNKTWNNRNEENQYVSELNDIDMELNILWCSLLISLEVEMSTVCVCVGHNLERDSTLGTCRKFIHKLVSSFR